MENNLLLQIKIIAQIVFIGFYFCVLIDKLQDHAPNLNNEVWLFIADKTVAFICLKCSG